MAYETLIHSQTLPYIKLYAAVCQAISNAYPDKEVWKKTIHKLVIRLWIQEVFVCDNSSSDKTPKIMAIQISSISSETTAYGCKNAMLL